MVELLRPMIKTCQTVGYRSAIRALEKTLIEYALSRSHSVSEAARFLSVSRTTLIHRIKALKVRNSNEVH